MMKLKKRMIEGVKAEAEALTHKMPWERGARRKAFILSRALKEQPRRRARA
ncbi:hypothetical protein PSA7680_02503 [Pseudoruegeria aquimaris]|uniref:Uncharacterized protein n=1 Tax=Pseudoruegeria aquimaris TaxID=393663 RepID=A0A1Y5SU35_9RHOB|nr:hypothetical protein [Pseudoruegeria aquimaris]SLN48559.1 hypothetical protein PSA7680_02503 [Pseudoruegeria aquimaris]